ncbi:hypothetical protein ACFL1L_01215 [Thermoplasmatota archaeon]
MVVDSYESALKRRGNTLTNYISKKINVPIRLVYSKPCKDADGQTVCSREIIIIYWNKSDWEWLREVIVHESAHRLDHAFRGFKHHNPSYEHDLYFWECYNYVMKIANTSHIW